MSLPEPFEKSFVERCRAKNRLDCGSFVFSMEESSQLRERRFVIVDPHSIGGDTRSLKRCGPT